LRAATTCEKTQWPLHCQGKRNVIRCREIHEDDVTQVVQLLTLGFSRRAYWVRAMQRMADHPTPDKFPKYGYVLDNEGTLVGVVLLISTALMINGESRVRCNASSWYVMPEFRAFGSILSMRLLKHKQATIYNVSPAPNTWTILAKQGFVPFANGRCIAAPLLSRTSGMPIRVRQIAADEPAGADLAAYEITILRDHQGYGCLSLICEFEGVRRPFVFGRQRRYGFLPVAHLVYCRAFDEFVRFAGAIGHCLARHGYFAVIFDADGRVPEIICKYYPGRPRFRKGGDQIRIGDVAYSEQVLFGY